jgi:hypothetical protein
LVDTNKKKTRDILLKLSSLEMVLVGIQHELNCNRYVERQRSRSVTFLRHGGGALSMHAAITLYLLCFFCCIYILYISEVEEMGTGLRSVFLKEEWFFSLYLGKFGNVWRHSITEGKHATGIHWGKTKGITKHSAMHRKNFTTKN